MKRTMFTMLIGLLALSLSGCTGQPQADPTEAASPTTDTAQQPVSTDAPTADSSTTTPPDATTSPAGGETAQTPATGRLGTVIDRGSLICGVNGGLPGFSNLDPDGTFSGFDVDFCRVVAAAALGDPEAVEFRPLSAQERFTAVQTGEVDVLFRNTTWTLNRDSAVGMDFGPTTFYDGQGIMALASLNATQLEDLVGATVCVQTGTTTELNLTDQFRARNIEFDPLVFSDIDATYAAYDEGRCDAVTSDRSQLVSRRTTLQNPGDHVILDAVLSKEPLSPAVAQGDSQWRDVVSWAIYATIQAEEFGINSGNIGDFLATENPDIQRFLGIDAEFGKDLGVANDFVVKIIEGVGNYGEIYDRNLGPGTVFDLDRGPNGVWTNDGLLYSPPFR
ncbi:MAG: transporter substrate-binding domain-containing protein [Chloroflexales bacterium]|nr:transporter substrate-binding domain-containing protein [Chloroflexales bacterium]